MRLLLYLQYGLKETPYNVLAPKATGPKIVWHPHRAPDEQILNYLLLAVNSPQTMLLAQFRSEDGCKLSNGKKIKLSQWQRHHC